MTAATGTPTITELDTSAQAAALCGLIYARSWPVTASYAFDDAAVAARIAQRPVSFWARILSQSPVRLAGQVGDAHGFALVTTTADGFELSYLFLEPEAIGSGLAATLYDEVRERAPGPLHAWVLTGNERSLRFFTARGWRADPGAGQPDWGGGHAYTLLRPQPDGAPQAAPEADPGPGQAARAAS